MTTTTAKTKTKAAAKKAAPKKAAPAGVSRAEFEEMRQGQAEVLDMISSLSQAVSSMAKNNPVTTSAKGLDTRDMETGNEGDVSFSTEITGADDAEMVITRSTVADPESPQFGEKMKNLAFMNEIITVVVNESEDIHADPVVEIGVNGKYECFKRGVPKQVKRMFAEGLARAKPVKFRNVTFVNGEGVEDVKHPAMTSQRYPFQVISDKNPIGASWLQAIMAQRS